MKLFSIIAITQLTSAASISHNSNRQRSLAHLIKGRSAECAHFIRRNANNYQWAVNTNQEVFEKRCFGEVTYDAHFCTMVCELQEGDRCSTTESIGQDVCGTGLICEGNSRHGTCQQMYPMDDNMFADDSSDDMLELLNFLDMIGEY